MPPVYQYPGPAQFIRFLTGWRASLRKILAIWQQQRPGAEIGFRWLWCMVTPLDIEIENMLQSVNDWAPGSLNASATALPLIGQSRGLIQGEAETDDHFAQRLQQWRAINIERGKSTRLALEIQNYLGNTPLVRVIERIWSAPGSGAPRALYCTANPDGTTSEVAATWDWDSVLGWTDDTQTYSGDTCRTFAGDIWIVVYPCEWPRGASVTPLTGQEVPELAHTTILRLVHEWKGLHVFVRAIIWSYNSALFDPANPLLAGNPDGSWGNWGKDDGSGNQVPARNVTDARYWIPPTGG